MIDNATYNIIYLITNIFFTYTIYKYMQIFFCRDNNKKIKEISSYVFYAVVTGILYFFFNTPVMNLVFNLILFFNITLNYNATLKIRITSVLCLYTVFIFVETFVVFLIMNLKSYNLTTYRKDRNIIVLTLILSKILVYIIVLIIKNIKSVKEQIDVPILYWVSIIVIPSGTIYITNLSIAKSNYLSNISLIICICVLFIINILVFFLYDRLVISFNYMLDKNLLKQQNDYYKKQFEIIEETQMKTTEIRHDIKNHFISLRYLIKNNRNDEADCYIQELIKTACVNNNIVNSGHVGIDSILNYKLDKAKNNNININYKINVPPKMKINDIDMNIIIGNLLDNAIEAVSKVNENKIINLQVNYDRNSLYICVQNTYNGKILNVGTKLKTIKEDKQNHGLGINNIKKVIKKYNGDMNVSYNDNDFTVSIIVYNI